jgi:hypothetical protein
MNISRGLAALSLLACASVVTLAQTPAGPLPMPRLQFFDSSGRPLAGGKVYTYSAGTSTPLATYSDATGSVLNTNPVILDAGGFANIWVKNSVYRIVVQNSAGVQQWTADNVANPGAFAASGGYAVLDSNGFVPQAELNFTAAGTGAVNRSVQNKLSERGVSVRDYGAAGDGVTDDLAAFQRAALALPATGGTINIPNGKYKLSGTWVISNPGVVVQGCGSNQSPVFDASDTAACKVDYQGAAAAPAISVQANMVRLTGFSIGNSGGAGTIGIEIKGNYFDADHIAVLNPSNGFTVAAIKTDAAAVRQQIYLDKLFLQGNAAAVILEQTIAARLTNVRSVKNGASAIQVGPTVSCFNIAILGSTFDVFDTDSLTAAAITVYKASNVSIENNYFELAEWDSVKNPAASGQLALRLSPTFDNDNMGVYFVGNWVQANSVLTNVIGTSASKIINGLTVSGNIFRAFLTAAVNVPLAQPLTIEGNATWQAVGLPVNANASSTTSTGVVDSALLVRGQLQAAGGLTLASALSSTVATGTAPLTVSSTTPVTNLVVDRHPLVYDSGSNLMTGGEHIAIGAVTLSGTTGSATFTGSAVFTNSSSYVCSIAGGTSTATRGYTKTSGSSISFTSSVAGEAISYICVGK